MIENEFVTEASVWLKLLEPIGIIIAFVVAGKAAIVLIDRVVRKLTARTSTQLDDMLLAVVEKPTFHLIVLWGTYYAIHNTEFDIAPKIFDIIDNAVFVIVVAYVVKVAYDVINASIDWYGIRALESGRQTVARSVLPLTKKLVKIFAILSGLIVVLDHFNYNIATLVAALGVSSLAIGLAAKETLSNMISGFAIAADQPFRIGDRIEVDGRVGDVMEIGLRSTKVGTLDNNIIVIPNSKLVDNVVVNYAYPENTTVYTIKIGVEYGTDPAHVKDAMLRAAAEVPEILEDPAPLVFFIEHADFALMFLLIYRIPEYSLKMVALDKLNMAINRIFTEEGLSFAFPTQTMYLHGVEKLAASTPKAVSPETKG